MNVIDIMVEGFKRVFSGQNALTKHLYLFLITAVISISSVYIQEAADAIEQTKELPANIPLLIIYIIMLVAFGIYIGGYNLIFSHNSFFRENETGEILPDINFKPLKVFFHAFPLMLVWTLYIFIIGIISILLMAGNLLIYKVLGIFIFLCIICFYAFVQFIYTAYSKHFDRKGLYNILLPISYIKHSFSDFILLGLLFIPVYIVTGFPGFVLGLIFGIINQNALTAGIYTGGIISGYLGFVVQIVWYYCLVQIFKEKIEPNMYM